MYTTTLLFACSLLFPPLALDGPSWQTHYDTAQKLVRERGKPLAVFIGSGDAGYNELLKEGQLGKETSRILSEEYICLYLDVARPGGKRLAAAFNLPAGPGLVISDPTGKLQAFRHEGPMAEDDLVRRLRKYSDRERLVRVTEGHGVERTDSAAGESQPGNAPAASIADLALESAPTELHCQDWINSKPLTLASLRGKVVLLDLWATWCHHCVTDLPEIQRAHELFGGKGLVVIGIHHNSVPADRVHEFVQNQQLSYPIALDNADGATCGSYNVNVFPTVILIDRQGKIIQGRHRGPELLEDVRRAVLASEDSD